jgi:archaellum component FlaF (FlaF/FlaG flagellin family)
VAEEQPFSTVVGLGDQEVEMSIHIGGMIHRAVLTGMLGVIALGTSLAQPAGAASSTITERVSVSTAGQEGNDISGRFAGPAISGDGGVVAFDSIASTLVPSDTNNEADVFVHDRTTNTTERVSVSTRGRQANEFSSRPALDGTGNLVAFDTAATNLTGADANGTQLDVFVHNRTTHKTKRVSVSAREVQGNSGSHSPSISADGRFVAFTSTASNLVPNDTSTDDIFVRDLVAGRTERVSESSTGEPGNSSSTLASISANGRWVVFQSFATNLVPEDTNGHFDVFIHDRKTGITELVSMSSDDAQGNAPSTRPTVSQNGQFVAFMSGATNLVPGDTNGNVDVFVRDRTVGTTERVSINSEEEQANGNSQDPGVRGFTASSPDITADGRYVGFFSSATNLVPGDTNTCPPVFEEPGRCPDVYVRDRVAGTTVRVNVATDGTEANERSADPAISEDGLVVAFFSAAGNLVPDDTNTCPGFTAFPGNCPDIFVRDGTVGGISG